MIDHLMGVRGIQDFSYDVREMGHLLLREILSRWKKSLQMLA